MAIRENEALRGVIGAIVMVWKILCNVYSWKGGKDAVSLSGDI